MHESRLFKILYYLLEKGQATAPELASKFEVSVRTIYRDIDVMSSAGIPVYAAAGRDGGIKLYDDFIISKALLSESDIQDIFIGLQSLSAAQYSDHEGTLEKLGALFKKTNTDWIEIDFSRWGACVQKEHEIFSLLKISVLKRQEIVFCYYNSRGEVSERRCRPIKLLYKDRSWYLFGFCCKRNDYRLFRVSRMRSLKLTEVMFDEIPHDNLNIWPLPEDMEVLNEIELRFPLDMGHRVLDIFSEEAIIQNDQQFIVKASLPRNEWLYEMLLSFGEKVEIVHPISLIKEIIERCEKALSHHKGAES